MTEYCYILWLAILGDVSYNIWVFINYIVIFIPTVTVSSGIETDPYEIK